jgi:hypothetical protein
MDFDSDSTCQQNIEDVEKFQRHMLQSLNSERKLEPIFAGFCLQLSLKITRNHIQTMPSTRSRTSTEAPEVAAEDKKTEVTEQQAEDESEVKESPTDEKIESSAEQSSDSTSADEKPVDKSEENTNGSTTSDALPSDTNGDQTENGSAKRKSTADESGDAAPDSTDITPKKVKLDDESNGTKEVGAGEETDNQTPVETSA